MDINAITFGVELEMSYISRIRALTATKKALQTCGVFARQDERYAAGLRDTPALAHEFVLRYSDDVLV